MKNYDRKKSSKKYFEGTINFSNKRDPIIECDKSYIRPLDVDTLLGDARKARKLLKWKPKNSINLLIDEMIESEYKILNAFK